MDAITLADELDERGDLESVGGRGRVHELAALVPASANARHYAQIIRETATLRGLIQAGGEISRLGWERPGDAVELVDRAEQILFKLSQQRATTNDVVHIEELLKESVERITALYRSGADATGTPTGFRDIDRITSGFQPGNLIIVAARPSMGKSALGLCIAANMAVRHSIPVALFTVEMSKSEVTQRLVCSEAKIESHPVRNRDGELELDRHRLTAAGISARAARELAHSLRVPCFTLHDMDKNGFVMAAGFPFATDIGIRMADVGEWGLEPEEQHHRNHWSTRRNLLENGATLEEAEFISKGRRVELNMLTSSQFIEFVEAKLEEHGVEKVVPDEDTLRLAWRRAHLAMKVKKLIDEIQEKNEGIPPMPDDRETQLREKLQDTDESWDDLLAEIAEESS